MLRKFYLLRENMFFSKTLYDKLFWELAEHQDHTIQTLHQAINRKEKISLPNFYKVIDQLLTNQILSKEQGKIKLHTAWILSLFELHDKVKKNYIDNTSLKTDLQEGEQKVFYASSLVELDNIWAELLNSMAFKDEKQEGLFMYNAHVYHILGMPETEATNFKNMKQQLWKVHLLVGNESVMDMYAAEQIRLLWIDIVCNNQHQFLKDGYFINVVGDYILEALFPDIISQYFKVFFDNVNDIKDFNPEGFQSIFKMKSGCKITFRRSSSQAKIFKKEIKKYFK